MDEGTAAPVRPLFEILGEISNLFLVRPNAVMNLLGEYSLHVNPKLMVPYLSLREDYHQAGLDRVYPHLEKSFFRLQGSRHI